SASSAGRSDASGLKITANGRSSSPSNTANIFFPARNVGRAQASTSAHSGSTGHSSRSSARNGSSSWYMRGWAMVATLGKRARDGKPRLRASGSALPGAAVGCGDGLGLGGAALAQEDAQHGQRPDGEELALPVLQRLEPERRAGR